MTALDFLQSTRKRSDPSFFGPSTMGAVHSISKISITFIIHMLSISSFSNARALCPSLYSVQCRGQNSSDASFMHCLAALMEGRWRAPVDWPWSSYEWSCLNMGWTWNHSWPLLSIHAPFALHLHVQPSFDAWFAFAGLLLPCSYRRVPTLSGLVCLLYRVPRYIQMSLY